jgi:hypothetical protein
MVPMKATDATTAEPIKARIFVCIRISFPSISGLALTDSTGIGGLGATEAHG